jgi:hypothetical protein
MTQHYSFKIFVFFLVSIFKSGFAFAYPEFISYGYASCLTCHFNGQGSGPLNDYGRALWSAEIASRFFYSAKTTDEKIAEKSGFLGSTENTPWWIRPHLKYRGLKNTNDLGSSRQQEKFYHMQLDWGSVFIFDPDQKNIFVTTWGYFPLSAEDATKAKFNRFLAKDFYIRHQLAESHWLYFGLQDKIFGIRNLDHTSFSRRPQKLTLKNDQSVALAYHWTKESFELSSQLLAGNPYEEDAKKLKGISLKYEKNISEKFQLASSVLSQQNSSQKIQLLAFETRKGLQIGTSLIGELGFISNEENSKQKTGSWVLLGTQNLLTRGQFFRFQIEKYNEEFKATSPDQWRWLVGYLAFPFPRAEIRLDLLHNRSLQNQGSTDDVWLAQGQIHVSL